MNKQIKSCRNLWAGGHNFETSSHANKLLTVEATCNHGCESPRFDIGLINRFNEYRFNVQLNDTSNCFNNGVIDLIIIVVNTRLMATNIDFNEQKKY